MYMTTVNYNKSMTPQTEHDEVSYSDLENVAVSPDDNRIDVINVEQSSIDDKSSEKGAKNEETKCWTMAKVQVGYDVTRKGERSLVVDGFKFTKSRDGTNNRIFWRCSKRECKATAVTVCNKVEHVRAIHAHEPPLAAEFFGSHEGVMQHCELQDVRFNTNAANIRPRYRRSNLSVSESNPEESIPVMDSSNSTNNKYGNNSTFDQKCSAFKSDNITNPTNLYTIDNKPSTITISNPQQKINHSAKDQIRDFILKNSAQNITHPQNNSVSVAQFLISPNVQSPFLQTNNNYVSSSNCNNSSTAFNFNPIHIGALSSNGSDSPSDISSHKSTPGRTNVLSNTPRDNSPTKTMTASNQLQVEDIIQLLIKSESSRKRYSSGSEWCSPTPGPGIQQFDQGSNSPGTVTYNDSYQALSTPSRFVHWKKEKIRESKICDQLQIDRKRRCEDQPLCDNQWDQVVNTTTASDHDPNSLASSVHTLRSSITRKLMKVMQKLTSELCPEEAVAQDVFEKCTAIKTCLETLEKLHSFTGFLENCAR